MNQRSYEPRVIIPDTVRHNLTSDLSTQSHGIIYEKRTTEQSTLDAFFSRYNKDYIAPQSMTTTDHFPDKDEDEDSAPPIRRSNSSAKRKQPGATATSSKRSSGLAKLADIKPGN